MCSHVTCGMCLSKWSIEEKAVCSNLGNCEGLRLSLSCVEGVKTMGLGDSDMMHECELQTEETEAQ